jgi:hypothetical protein
MVAYLLQLAQVDALFIWSQYWKLLILASTIFVLIGSSSIMTLPGLNRCRPIISGKLHPSTILARPHLLAQLLRQPLALPVVAALTLQRGSMTWVLLPAKLSLSPSLLYNQVFDHVPFLLSLVFSWTFEQWLLSHPTSLIHSGYQV